MGEDIDFLQARHLLANAEVLLIEKQISCAFRNGSVYNRNF